MNRSEDASAAAGPRENELLRKLDEGLRKRATAIVDEALKDAESSAIRRLADGLASVAGDRIKADVIRHISEACCRIRDTAIDLTYRDLAERVAAQLSDGQTVELT